MAGSSLAAVWLDPVEPSVGANTAYVLLIAYAIYAILVAGWVWERSAIPSGQAIAMHVVDLGVFALLMYLVRGPSSPFFVYFTFAEVAAAIRWQWRGTLWTAAAAILLYGSMAGYVLWLQQGAGVELDRVIIRSTYLLLLALLLGYLSAHEARTRREIRMLGAWPRVSTSAERTIEASARHAAEVLRWPRVLIWWEDVEEPSEQIAEWRPDSFRLETVQDEIDRRPIADDDTDIDGFLIATKGEVGVWVLREGAMKRLDVAPLDPGFRDRYQIQGVAALRLRGLRVAGWLFLLDRDRVTSEDLGIAAAVAGEIAHRLDQIHMADEGQRTAIAAERLRLAGDLHDGVLQTLTGLSMQVRSAQEIVQSHPAAAIERLDDVQRLLDAQHRDLRGMIKEFRPEGSLAWPVLPSLDEQLAALAAHLESAWGVPVHVDIDADTRLSDRTRSREVYRLVQEAVFNAARHARPTRVAASVATRPDGSVRIRIEDDGRGFAFQGRLDHHTLRERELGPVSIRERLERLGGILSVESSSTGSVLEMTLPGGNARD